MHIDFYFPSNYYIGVLEGSKQYKIFRKEGKHMKTVKISLSTIDKVKSFVNDVSKFNSDFDLVSGRYVIDAKSIMGIFSLDLSKDIDLNIHDDENADEILKVLDPYIVK